MNLRVVLGAAAALALVAVPATAQTIATSGANPVAVNGVASHQTNFSELTGMQVAWTFGPGGGPNGSGTWGNLGGGYYGVSGANFILGGAALGDTYTSPWMLSAHNLTGFSIRSIPGNSVFDIRSSGGATSTPGSDVGQEFDYDCTGDNDSGVNGNCFGVLFGNGSDFWNTTVTYSRPVSVIPNPAVGDLYGQMSVSFGTTFDTASDANCSTFFGLFFTNTSGCDYVEFSQDMDNVFLGPDQPSEVTPEPATMTLLATGLAGMAAARRRRNKK